MSSEKIKNYDSLMILIYIIVGLIMLINPKFISDAINYILGSIIIVFGIVFLFKLLQTKEFKELSKLELLIALLCVAFGLFLIFNSAAVLSILPIAFGIIILLDAVLLIVDGLKLKKYKDKYWYISAIIGLIFLIFAVYIIVNSTKISYLIIRIIGGVLLVDGIIDFLSSARIKKYTKNMLVIDVKDNQE